MTLWFHPACAAFKRPQPLLEILAETTSAVPERATLERVARAQSAHRRLPRIDGAERASRGQAKCRSCHGPIPRGTWRIRLVFFEEGRFTPGGFLHLGCRRAYFESDDVLGAVLHFSHALTGEERHALEQACAAEADGKPAPRPPE